jgi:ferredoxin
MKNFIFYFSGTGNSLYITKKVADSIGNTEVIRIDDKISLSDEFIEKFKDSEYLGFIAPVYSLGLPIIVNDFIKNFLLKLKSKGLYKDQYIFVILNYGGVQLQAIGQVYKLFKKLNIDLSFATSFKMPDNYIPMYNIPSKEKVDKILKDADNKLKEIVDLIKDRKINLEKSFVAFEVLGKLLYNLFVGFIKKYNPSKSFWVTEKCSGCSVCEKVCPVSNIAMNEENKPVWNDRCEFCLACISWCPEKAIQYKKSTLKKSRYSNPNILVKELIEHKK